MADVVSWLAVAVSRVWLTRVADVVSRYVADGVSRVVDVTDGRVADVPDGVSRVADPLPIL